MAGPRILSPDELRRSLADAEPAPVYLLAGPDSWRAERTAQWLRSKLLDPATAEFNAQVLYADEHGPAAIAESASAYPMFGSRRFIWVRHAESLPSGTAIDPLLRYLERPAETTVLVFTSHKLDKRLKFTNACATAGCAADFQHLSGKALLQQVLRQARGHELGLTPEAVETLVDLIGEDLGEIDTELAKLALLREKDSTIGPDEVRSLVAHSRDIDAFEVAELLRADDPIPALRSWMGIRAGGGDTFQTAAILNWRLRQLALLRAAMEEGDRPADAAKRAGLAPWQARRMEALARATTLEALERTLRAFREADRRAKSSRLGADLAYDLALLEWAADSLHPRNDPRNRDT